MATHEHDIKHLDKRTQARYVGRGVIAEKDLEKAIKALPDLSDDVRAVETQQPASDRAPTR